MKIGKLYYQPVTLGGKCLWLMNELGVSVERKLLDMKNGEHKSAEYMKLNPHGTSPTLVLTDGRALWESGAIIHHVLDNFDTENKLKGAPGSNVRTTFLLYQSFAGEAEPPMIRHFIHLKMLPEAMRSAEVIATAKKHWDDKLVHFYDNLITSPDQEFVCGDQFSAADVSVSYPLFSSQQDGIVGGEAQSYKLY